MNWQQVVLNAAAAESSLRCREILVGRLHDFLLASRASVAANGTQLLEVAAQLMVDPAYAPVTIFLLAVQTDALSSESIRIFVTLGMRTLQCLDTSDKVQAWHKEVSIVAHKLVDILCSMRAAAGLVSVLMTTADLLAPNPNCLTAVHADVLQVLPTSSLILRILTSHHTVFVGLHFESDVCCGRRLPRHAPDHGD
jgi:hypothetical protein